MSGVAERDRSDSNSSIALIGAALDKSDGALDERSRVFLAAFDVPADEPSLDALERVLDDADAGKLWLLAAVLTGKLPTHADVEQLSRQARLDGPLDVIAGLMTLALATHAGKPWPAVEILTGKVLIDLHHTSQASFATGIQRVARECALRWHRDHDVMLIGWNEDFEWLRRLDEIESHRALHGGLALAASDEPGSVLVPWKCTIIVPELPVEPTRAVAFQAVVRHSRSVVGLIGHDCVPLTTSETTADGMGAAFALMLSAVTYIDRIAAVSQASAREWGGWRRMLAGRGLPGPAIQAIPLGVTAQPVDEGAVDTVRSQLGTPGVPMVLIVGSHEPRKNHLAILHACELLWRRGLSFSAVFVGGNSWSSDRFTERLKQLQDESRPVHSVATIDDKTLWSAYRVARCTLFPSLNEGFGLPVAESLACGTPVITSNFGSMLETSAHGGVLAVDPRDDRALSHGLATLLTDDAAYARLKTQALAAPIRSWDSYARQTWDYLVEAKSPTD